MPENDEAQQRGGQPATRQTVQQQVTALREELDAYQRVMTDKLATLRTEVRQSSQSGDVPALVHQTMEPIVAKANSNHTAMLARLEALERTAAEHAERLTAPAGGEGYATALQARIAALESSPAGNMDELLSRLGVLERQTSGPNISTLLPKLDAIGDEVLELGTRVSALERDISASVRLVMPAAPRVHGKVLELMKRVNLIGKDKTADPKMGGYAFRGIDQVMDAVGVAIRDVGLTMETRVLQRDYVTDQSRNAEGKTLLWTSCRLVIAYTFVDPEDGSRHTFEMAGEARATDDKATSKAESMALKYGLLHALMIPVEGMPDADGESPQVFQEQTRERVTGPPSTPGPARDDERRREFSKAELAKAALEALDRIGRVHPDQRHAELVRIQNKIVSNGLGSYEINGATLQAHAIAVMHTLGGQPGGEPGTGF